MGQYNNKENGVVALLFAVLEREICLKLSEFQDLPTIADL